MDRLWWKGATKRSRNRALAGRQVHAIMPPLSLWAHGVPIPDGNTASDLLGSRLAEVHVLTQVATRRHTHSDQPFSRRGSGAARACRAADRDACPGSPEPSGLPVLVRTTCLNTIGRIRRPRRGGRMVRSRCAVCDVKPQVKGVDGVRSSPRGCEGIRADAPPSRSVRVPLVLRLPEALSSGELDFVGASSRCAQEALLPRVYAQGALRADREGWAAQARKPSLGEYLAAVGGLSGGGRLRPVYMEHCPRIQKVASAPAWSAFLVPALRWTLVLLDRVAAIDHERLTGDVARSLGREERDRLGYLVGPTAPAKWRVAPSDRFLRRL
jgi:hypothetical protein